MKSKFNALIICALLVTILTATSTIPAHAKTTDAQEPLTTRGYTETRTILEHYSNLYMGYGPINSYLWVEAFNINVYHAIDVRMLDKNGNVLWEKHAAIGPGATERFWCGPDVYVVQGRTVATNILGNLSNRISYCNVWTE